MKAIYEIWEISANLKWVARQVDVRSDMLSLSRLSIPMSASSTAPLLAGLHASCSQYEQDGNSAAV
jgi:hypothetical protein